MNKIGTFSVIEKAELKLSDEVGEEIPTFDAYQDYDLNILSDEIGKFLNLSALQAYQ